MAAWPSSLEIGTDQTQQVNEGLIRRAIYKRDFPDKDKVRSRDLWTRESFVFLVISALPSLASSTP